MSTLYDHRSGLKHTSLSLNLKYYPPIKPPKSHFWAKTLGSSLIATSLMLFILLFWPIAIQEANYFLNTKSRTGQIVTDDSYYLDEIKAKEKAVTIEEARGLDLSSAFAVYIPKINAKANVTANVDAGDEAAYREALKVSVAHAKGTYFPGQDNLIYLFAHSTNISANISRYNAVFFLLHKLEAGDEIVVYFADQKYLYRVTDKLITEADDTSWLTKNYSKETLILQTCWPPGTALKRLIVVGERG